MIFRTLFASIAAICFVTAIASAQVTPAPMMNPAAPMATPKPQKKCQQNPPSSQNPNGGCKKKKKKKNKNPNGAAPHQGMPPQGPSQQAPPQQAPHPMTTP